MGTKRKRVIPFSAPKRRFAWGLYDNKGRLIHVFFRAPLARSVASRIAGTIVCRMLATPIPKES